MSPVAAVNKPLNPLHLVIKRKLQQRYQSALCPGTAAISSADPWGGLHFKLEDFQQVAPEDFLDAAYRAVLKRYPDHAGFHYYLAILKQGRSRNEVLYALRHSPEGELVAVTIDQLLVPARTRVQQMLRQYTPALARGLSALRIRARRSRPSE